jgi:hypothetical protein
MSVKISEQTLRGLDARNKAKLWHIAKRTIDALDEMYEKQKTDNEQYQNAKEMRAIIEGLLMEELDTTGAKNIGTVYGTIHTVTRYSAPLEDPQAFMDFVIQTERWGMVDKKANVTAVRDYVEEHKGLPPGVRLTSHTRLSITAPKEAI